MIRFMIARGPGSEVSVKALFGWTALEGDDLEDWTEGRGPLGYGKDPWDHCTTLGYLLLRLSLEREPLVGALLMRFVREVIRQGFAPSWTISSEDIREWAFDAIATDIENESQSIGLVGVDPSEGIDDGDQ